jgi:hypothetical protein
MIKYLKIKRTSRVRKDGSKATEIFYMEKDGKMGKVLAEKSISTKKSVLVCGKAASGKTRWIKRMVENSPQIWRKITVPVIFMSSDETIAEWREIPSIKKWWEKENPEKEWKKQLPHEKKKVILDYVSQNWTIIFIDNIESLAGRKLNLVKDVLTQSKSKIWVCSTIAENRINPSLRNFITKSNPQIFTLNSPVSYDATNAVTAVVCAIFVIVGWYQVAIMLAGLKMLSRGMFSTKQQ